MDCENCVFSYQDIRGYVCSLGDVDPRHINYCLDYQRKDKEVSSNTENYSEDNHTEINIRKLK